VQKLDSGRRKPRSLGARPWEVQRDVVAGQRWGGFRGSGGHWPLRPRMGALARRYGLATNIDVLTMLMIYEFTLAANFAKLPRRGRSGFGIIAWPFLGVVARSAAGKVARRMKTHCAPGDLHRPNFCSHCCRGFPGVTAIQSIAAAYRELLSRHLLRPDAQGGVQGLGSLCRHHPVSFVNRICHAGRDAAGRRSRRLRLQAGKAGLFAHCRGNPYLAARTSGLAIALGDAVEPYQVSASFAASGCSS